MGLQKGSNYNIWLLLLEVMLTGTGDWVGLF